MTISTTIRAPAEQGPQVLRPQQIKALLGVPDRRTWLGRRDAALLATMLLAGLRVHEAVKLRRDAVQEEHGKLRLVFAGKGGRVRTVTLPPTGARLLRGWLADPKAHPHWVFPGRRNEHLSIRAAQDIVYKRCRQAGLPGWLHAHSLRHTFASTLMRATGDLFVTQRVLGHASPATTSKYYLAFSARDADEAAEAIEVALGMQGHRAHACR